jgi:hypothetical protein
MLKLFPDTPTTEHLFDAHITLATPEQIGATPHGLRSVHVVAGGTFDGPRLRGEIRPGGADWLLSFAGGYNELDVRLTMQADDGALIFMSYRGVLQVDNAVIARVMAGEKADPSSYYFRTAPRFETGSEKHAWLNTQVAIAYGYFGAQKVGYRVFGVL